MNTLRTYLRHVVYKHDHYRCGICDSSYKKESEAKACLGSCWQEVLSQSLVSIAQSFPKTKFRCKLCFRKYETYESAVKCTVDCRTAFKPVLIDQGAFDIPVKPKFFFGIKPPKKIHKDAEVKMIDEDVEAKEQVHEDRVHAGIGAKEQKEANIPEPKPIPAPVATQPEPVAEKTAEKAPEKTPEKSATPTVSELGSAKTPADKP